MTVRGDVFVTCRVLINTTGDIGYDITPKSRHSTQIDDNVVVLEGMLWFGSVMVVAQTNMRGCRGDVAGMSGDVAGMSGDVRGCREVVRGGSVVTRTFL